MIRLWTDGCCLKNPGGGGGWAFVVEDGGEVIHTGFGSVAKSTNNQMEMRAVIEALRWSMGMEGLFRVVSDSKYVVEGMNVWRHNWKRNGWRKTGLSPKLVRNADLWRELDVLAADRPIEFRWVKGHAGANFNEAADQLAGEAARAA